MSKKLKEADLKDMIKEILIEQIQDLMPQDQEEESIDDSDELELEEDEEEEEVEVEVEEDKEQVKELLAKIAKLEKENENFRKKYKMPSKVKVEEKPKEVIRTSMDSRRILK